MTVTRISLALGLTVVLWGMIPARLSASEELITSNLDTRPLCSSRVTDGCRTSAGTQ